MTSSLYYVISIFVAIPRKIFTPSFWKRKFPKLNNKSLMMSTAPHTEIISMLIRRIALHSITSQLPLFEPAYTLYHSTNERAPVIQLAHRLFFFVRISMKSIVFRMKLLALAFHTHIFISICFYIRRCSSSLNLCFFFALRYNCFRLLLELASIFIAFMYN